MYLHFYLSINLYNRNFAPETERRYIKSHGEVIITNSANG